jgi:hypothetical protein
MLGRIDGLEPIGAIFRLLCAPAGAAASLNAPPGKSIRLNRAFK